MLDPRKLAHRAWVVATLTAVLAAFGRTPAPLAIASRWPVGALVAAVVAAALSRLALRLRVRLAGTIACVAAPALAGLALAGSSDVSAQAGGLGFALAAGALFGLLPLLRDARAIAGWLAVVGAAALAFALTRASWYEAEKMLGGSGSYLARSQGSATAKVAILAAMACTSFGVVLLGRAVALRRRGT